MNVGHCGKVDEGDESDRRRTGGNGCLCPAHALAGWCYCRCADCDAVSVAEGVRAPSVALERLERPPAAEDESDPQLVWSW